MPYNYRIIFLFLSIFSGSLLAEKSTVDIKPLEEPNAQEIINNFINNQQKETSHSIDQQAAFTDLEIKQMEIVFIQSPEEAQHIVNHLQDPSYFPLNESYRSVVFVGEPGTGKTVTAKAIAHQMKKHNWQYRFLPSTSLLGEHRNQSARMLQKELEDISKSKKPTILIIDELNLLMENSESKNHDTDATAKALWMFLDTQKDNKNFFFIGTMNRINKLPKPYKNRILFDYIKFPLMTDPAIKSKLLRDYLTNPYTQLDKEVTDTFLTQEIEKIGDSSGRDLENILKAICRKSKMDQKTPSSPLIIKQAAVTYIVDQYVRKKIESDYDIIEETDEERHNRHHRENLAMQDRHFVQQQKIQMIMHNNQYVNIKKHTNIGKKVYVSSDETIHEHGISAAGIEEINNTISDEQNEIYNDTMKATNKRKADEEAMRIAMEKAAEEAAQAAAEAAAKKAAENSGKWFWQK